MDSESSLRGHGTAKQTGSMALGLSALGVVFGDIGTSPLYVLRTVFMLDGRAVPLNREDITGVISCIVWVLVLIVTIKYVCFVLRADNDGDGGICDAVCLDRLEDGAARRSARLAVITRTLAVSAYAEYHCVGDMARLIVFLLNALQPYAHRFLILCVDDVREKARALNLVQNRGDTVRRHLPCDGRIGFHRHLFLRLK